MKTFEAEQQIKNAMEKLRALRTDIRVHLHLGELALRTAFEQLQPRVVDAERRVRGATADVLKDLQKLTRKLEALRNKLRLKETDILASSESAP